MKLISWNVNGLRACREKGFEAYLSQEEPDMICLQETKMQPTQADFTFEGYEMYWNSAVKKGYSGTAVITRHKPLAVSRGMHKPEKTEGSQETSTIYVGTAEDDDEGRVLTLEFEQFYLVTLYSPNVKQELSRLDYRCEWQDRLVAYVKKLDETKPVVICGDLNVAHCPIDLKNDKTNKGNAGFTDEERGKMTELLAAGFSDTYRKLYPDREEYSWWSYRFKAREKNAGWRIDYFVVSDRFMPMIKEAFIRTQQLGSDHCPVGIEV